MIAAVISEDSASANTNNRPCLCGSDVKKLNLYDPLPAEPQLSPRLLRIIPRIALQRRYRTTRPLGAGLGGQLLPVLDLTCGPDRLLLDGLGSPAL